MYHPPWIGHQQSASSPCLIFTRSSRALHFTCSLVALSPLPLLMSLNFRNIRRQLGTWRAHGID
ncbi:DEKNAAC100839 [Brettanomyces naardenensis]|uniref:DEKNAAC100839 n=1 Tax=Brettanomyces naardenensis TaxID=13370 RepID=A0A448YEF8_BRENA|nr:DEKNAAC100839 [Brettanomyces naardenensis]